MAALIRRPGIPAPLSESLIAHAAPSLFGATASAAYGGDRADLVVAVPGTHVFVEVKATGSGEFQEIKPRDLAADVLVWVAFGSRYESGGSAVDAYVLPQPTRFVPPLDRAGQSRRKLTLPVFLAIAAHLEGFSPWRFEDVPGVPHPIVSR
jgi:hypothetical protein